MSNEKQLTPLQELIEWLNDNKENFQSKDMGWQVLDKATSLLPKEREGYEQAHIDGQLTAPALETARNKRASDYFAQTFKQQPTQ